jgi:hypothetical protein
MQELKMSWKYDGGTSRPCIARLSIRFPKNSRTA